MARNGGLSRIGQSGSMRIKLGIRGLLLKSLLIWLRIRGRFSLGNARWRDIWLRRML